jgi:hypothetical protein
MDDDKTKTKWQYADRRPRLPTLITAGGTRTTLQSPKSTAAPLAELGVWDNPRAPHQKKSDDFGLKSQSTAPTCVRLRESGSRDTSCTDTGYGYDDTTILYFSKYRIHRYNKHIYYV